SSANSPPHSQQRDNFIATLGKRANSDAHSEAGEPDHDQQLERHRCDLPPVALMKGMRQPRAFDCYYLAPRKTWNTSPTKAANDVPAVNGQITSTKTMSLSVTAAAVSGRAAPALRPPTSDRATSSRVAVVLADLVCAASPTRRASPLTLRV